MLKYLLTTAAAVALLGACGQPPASGTGQTDSPAATRVEGGAAAQAETQRLYDWMQSLYQAELAYSPQGKASLGMIDADYGRWDDGSDAAAVAEHEREQGYLAYMLANFDYDAMTPEGQLSWRFARFQWEMNARLFAVRDSGYVFSPMRDAVSGLTTFLINTHRVSSVDHAQAYVSRLQGIGAVIDTLVKRAETRAANGVRLPLFAYPRLTASAVSQMTGAPFDDSGTDSALFADFKAKVASLDLPGEEADALIDAARTALLEVYQPALQRYVEALARMEADADSRDGIWKVPGGAEFYAAQVNFFTTRDDLTPEDVHRIGLSEVSRIQSEMRGIMDEVGFDGTLQDFFEFLRTDPQFYYPDTPEGQQAYLDESTRVIEAVMERAPDFFNRLPRAGLEARAVEPWREATASGAFYNRPALDGSRPGYFYANLSNMADNPTYLLESLALHEGAPGHHFQIALAQELEDVPMIQKLAWYSAYGEGWALYAEALGKDMGFFTDPYRDFGRLSYELFRAVRLVVDTGIHDQRWTREEAIAYMMENTPMTEGDITPEVERYIVWPAQAISYKIGMLTIMDLRQQAMERLGDDFSYGGFHDAVLTAGTIPLPILRERVMAWIESVEAARSE